MRNSRFVENPSNDSMISVDNSPIRIIFIFFSKGKLCIIWTNVCGILPRRNYDRTSERERERKKRKFLENWREKRSEDVGRTDVRREEQLERGNKESG